MGKLLVTGYWGPRTEPEPEACINPSGLVAQRLNEQNVTIGGIGYEIDGQVINSPVTERAELVRSLLASGQYAAHLALAVTSKRNFRLVKQVKNIVDTTALPNHQDGQIKLPIIDAEDAPDSITNNSVDFDRLLDRFEEHNWPAEVVTHGPEGSAAVAYAQIYYNGNGAPKLPVLAMNVPSTPEFANWNETYNRRIAEATLDLDTIVAASRVALTALLEPEFARPASL